MCGAGRTFQKLLDAGVSKVAHCKTSRSFRLIPKASRLQTNNSHFLFRFPNLTDGPKWLVRPVQRALVGLCRVFFSCFLFFFFASLRDHPHCSLCPPPDKEWIRGSSVISSFCGGVTTVKWLLFSKKKKRQNNETFQSHGSMLKACVIGRKPLFTCLGAAAVWE